MLVAPCERTTAGRGCLLGRGPAVRVADPEEADPAHPQRGHAPGSAMRGAFFHPSISYLEHLST